jgi:hypothetical protein
MIFLTAEEADKVRGFSPTKEGHALIPVECDDGRFKLGDEVLDASAFDHVRGFLAKLPRGEDQPAKELTESEAEAEIPAKLTVWAADRVQKREELAAPSTEEPALAEKR